MKTIKEEEYDFGDKVIITELRSQQHPLYKFKCATTREEQEVAKSFHITDDILTKAIVYDITKNEEVKERLQDEFKQEQEDLKKIAEMLNTEEDLLK